MGSTLRLVEDTGIHMAKGWMHVLREEHTTGNNNITHRMWLIS